jgi:TolA-binding protein
LLGSLYFQHKDFRKASTAFSDLIRKFPHSDHVPSSWFWAAECSDLEDNDPSIAREYRRTIFETFPESEYAPEAYFHFYSFAEYLQGNFQAMQHLKAMEKYFASSPYLIVSYYLQA